MSHIPQELHDLFPADAEVLRVLKADDRHFQALAARFGVLDEDVRRIEAEEEAASDERLETIKKQRLALLDEIAAAIAVARAAAS